MVMPLGLPTRSTTCKQCPYCYDYIRSTTCTHVHVTMTIKEELHVSNAPQ
jgi:hypothetical protein